MSTESSIDPMITAPMVLRSYLWEVLKLNTDMDETDYGGVVPIVPLSEEPEIKEHGKPYIVYGYAESTANELNAKYRGNISFVVHATNFRKLGEITNIIARVFEGEDESAARINRYSSGKDFFLGIRFGFTDVAAIEGGSPEETEGGNMSAAVNIRYEYFADYQINWLAT